MPLPNGLDVLGLSFMTFEKLLFEASSELRQVSWPTRDQVINHTAVVLALLAVVTLLIAGLDHVSGEGVLQLLRLGT
jgi:preprotein translocase SecE subunit